MPWWSWIVIWVALLALTALFFLFLGFRVFRGAVSTLGEFEAATDRLQLNSGQTPGSVDEGTGSAGSFAPAVFSTRDEVKAANALQRTERIARRRSARVRLRSERRQPQLLRDMPHL
ncbi:hypothetical protein [Arthrobacter sp. Br18]|uniref:hypothetical protein n=1 Tax=Arthrobacter sp. Br18 TaxID=1312954 RepID=UPI000478ADF9|nr:hypothetical protein [Arthrobacter sp. Br18]